MDAMTNLLSARRIQVAARSIRREHGSSLLEMAFVLPLLLLLTSGIMKAGILFNNWVMLTDSVRAGARVLAVSRAPNIDACALARTAVQNAAATLTTSNITITTAVSAGTCTNLTEGSDGTVTATYPCDLNVMGINFTPNGCTLRAATTERVE